MKLSSMRYKSFVWPHNPRVYTITFQRNMAVQKVPFGRYRLQDLGLTRRVMRGEGEFTGEDAYQQFKALGTLFYEETPGTLVHPLWDTTSAWFVGLELAQEPREDYVKYRFEFWEDYTGYRTGVEIPVKADPSPGAQGAETGGAAYHTVSQGQTLWGLAQQYGVGLNELIALNPQMKNPNLVQVGQRIRVK